MAHAHSHAGYLRLQIEPTTFRLVAQCLNQLRYLVPPKRIRSIEQIRSKDSQVKTQLVLWIFILFKVTR